MQCKKHQLIESTMINHTIGMCINCGLIIDYNGNLVQIDEWRADCSGADYYNGKFECAYGYTVKCKECTLAPKINPYE